MKLAAPEVLRFTGCSDYIAACGRRAGGDWQGIPNFFEIDALKFSPTVAPDAPLCFLSRVESIKGAHWAIEIARRTGHRLVIAGNHADSGAEGDYWRKEIEPWIGRDGIEYVGPVDDAQKNKVLGEARAMVVPIQWDEPFGIVFAEALACGTPVISCPRGSLPEIVRPGHRRLPHQVDRRGLRGCGQARHASTAPAAGAAPSRSTRPRSWCRATYDLYERARAALAARR